jgi:hypothetical protein
MDIRPLFTLDIEVYDTSVNKWAQGRYLVHGYTDICWTDDLDTALAFLKASIQEATANDSPNNARQ